MQGAALASPGFGADGLLRHCDPVLAKFPANAALAAAFMVGFEELRFPTHTGSCQIVIRYHRNGVTGVTVDVTVTVNMRNQGNRLERDLPVFPLIGVDVIGSSR
jgi:hypothetical protein